MSNFIKKGEYITTIYTIVNANSYIPKVSLRGEEYIWLRKLQKQQWLMEHNKACCTLKERVLLCSWPSVPTAVTEPVEDYKILIKLFHSYSWGEGPKKSELWTQNWYFLFCFLYKICWRTINLMWRDYLIKSLSSANEPPEIYFNNKFLDHHT